MPKQEHRHDPRLPDRWWTSPLAWLAGAWIFGLLLGRELGGITPWLWTAPCTLLLALLGIYLGRLHIVATMVSLAVVATGAAWWNLRVGAGAVWGLQAPQESVLVAVEGEIEGDVHLRREAKGLMGRFDYRPASVAFVLKVDRVRSGESWVPAAARVLVAIPEVIDWLEAGVRVRCTGWLSSQQSPMNPGERNRRREMRDRGMIGRLSLRASGNCEVLTDRQSWGIVARSHRGLTDRVSWAVGHGYSADQQRTVALLRVILLGRWDGELEDTRESFRRSGLMHVLAISGLHLAILTAAAWWGLLVLTGRPLLSVYGTLVIVGLYVLVIPPRVSILRSGLMTLVAFSALAMGRRVSGMAALCGAGLVLLVWRPQDLLSPGFQLSFVVVAALLLAAERVRDRLAPEPLVEHGGWRTAIRRWLGGYVAVGLVAWCASAPIMAAHFGTIVPAGFVATLLAIPLVTIILWVGFVKIALTLTWPAAGAILASPLGMVGEALAGFAGWASTWPCGVLELARPSPWWSVIMLAAIACLAAGGFGRWRRLGWICVLAVAAWPAIPIIAQPVTDRLRGPALRVHMLAVGHGSCYVLRSGGQTVVYDCGSSGYLDITTVAVGPALRELGVHRVDTLVLSHPDLDHFSGALELIDAFGTRRVVLSPAFGREAAENPTDATAFLIEQLNQRGVQMVEVTAGWSGRFGHAELRALWPPAGEVFDERNNASLVLAVEAGGRRVLMTGDMQEKVIMRMLDNPETATALDADVLELPHHGATMKRPERFIAAVSPRYVLQSASGTRFDPATWSGKLGGAQRFVTATHGAVEVVIGHDGEMDIDFFRNGMGDAEPGPYDEASRRVELRP